MPGSAPDRPSVPAITPPRRGFLGQLIGGAAAVLAGTVASRPLFAQPAFARATRSRAAPADTAAATPHSAWDMSWVDRITTAHREVFDAPAIAEGTAFNQARMYLAGFHDVYGTSDADVNAVVVVRHKGIPMVLDDPLWARYDFIGKDAKLKDPATGHDATRNPFLHAKPDDAHAYVWADGGLDALLGRGVIVLACNMALMGFAGIIAKRTKQDVDTVRDELRHGLVPGVTLMPSGIFGVTRAEEAGCHYIRAT